MHDNTKDAPAPYNTAPLDNTPWNCSMPKQDSDSPAKYSEDLTHTVI